jgi:hypothetical protein
MLKAVLRAAFSAGLIALSVSAKAGTLDVTWVEPGESISWQQKTDPTPLSYGSVDTQVQVSGASPSSISSIYYETNAVFGGFIDSDFLVTTGPSIG